MSSPLLGRMTTMGGTYGDALTRAQDRLAKRQDTEQKDILFRRGIEDQDAMRAAMPGAVAGDPTAITEVLRRDPQTGLKVMDYTKQQQQQALQKMQQATMASAGAVIMGEPEQRPALYDQARRTLQGMFPGKFDDLPEQYDDKSFLGMVAPMFPPEVMEKIVTERFKPKKFNGAHAGVDAKGNSVFFQTDDEGNVNTLPGVKPPPRNPGTSLQVSPDGTVSFSEGGAPPLAPTKPSANSLQETMITAQAGLDRLRAIKARYKPEYQTWEGKLRGFSSEMKDKAGLQLSDEEKKSLGEYSAYRSGVVDNTNRHIKDMTGASMSAQEAGRIQNSVPNENDGPTTFEAKMDRVMKDLGRAQARAYYALTKGLELDADGLEKFMSLEGVDDVIRKRGAEVEGQLKKAQPEMKPAELRDAVKKQLMREFGIGQ